MSHAAPRGFVTRIPHHAASTPTSPVAPREDRLPHEGRSRATRTRPVGEPDPRVPSGRPPGATRRIPHPARPEAARLGRRWLGREGLPLPLSSHPVHRPGVGEAPPPGEATRGKRKHPPPRPIERDGSQRRKLRRPTDSTGSTAVAGRIPGGHVGKATAKGGLWVVRGTCSMDWRGSRSVFAG